MKHLSKFTDISNLSSIFEQTTTAHDKYDILNKMIHACNVGGCDLMDLDDKTVGRLSYDVLGLGGFIHLGIKKEDKDSVLSRLGAKYKELYQEVKTPEGNA